MKEILQKYLKSFHGYLSIELARIWPSDANISEMRKLNQIQLSLEELQEIINTVKSTANCRLLVFGLGNDSLFWSRLNRSGMTIFLEDDKNWLEKITKRSKRIKAFPVTYNTRREDWRSLRESPSLLDMDLPDEVEKDKWDVILVDGPAGWKDFHPGRMKSIYLSARLIRDSGHVFVHDCEREVENVYSNRFLKHENLKTEIKGPYGLLRHYKMEKRPSKGEVLLDGARCFTGFHMKALPVVQSLWVGESLSVMENLCISSFLRKGHPFHLYAYDNVSGVPEGTTMMDAGKILPQEKIFKYSDHASYAGFANLFRYKLLLEKGGYWVDTDIVCLQPFQHESEYVFASQRRASGAGYPVAANNCLMKTPAGSAIMEACYSKASVKDPVVLKWGETGPELLTETITSFDMWSFVASPEVFCPVDYWDWKQFLEELPEENLLSGSQAVHLWNEMWRRDRIDKSGTFPRNSIYEQLKQAYLNG